MDGLIEQVGDFWTRQLLDAAVQQFYMFILIAIRLSGLFTVGPIFSQTTIPINVRVLLVLTLGFVITPVVQQGSGKNVAEYDQNRDGVLAESEVPLFLQGRFEYLANSVHGSRNGVEIQPGPQRQAVAVSAFSSYFTAPETLTELLRDIFTEFTLGFLLGLGVTVFLAGLQLSGQLIDQQLGLEFGEVVNPDLQGGASISSQTFFLLGGVCLLVMSPLNGHLMMLSALFETFDAMPVGDAFLFREAHILFSELVQKSLLLAVQVAAPIMATMGLVTISMGFLGHSVPQINQLVVGFPVRSLAGMLVLSLTLSGTGRYIVDSVPSVINDIQLAITSYQ
ncbi:MAG: flagellar biosynthetic protein FliR [Planctomycetaceae bacterium]|nr:flagellar biosynthetic protein FliR [Planctomycetaceae bacterium]